MLSESLEKMVTRALPLHGPRWVLLAVLVAAGPSPAAQAPAELPAFDVVSIKRNSDLTTPQTFRRHPDGGLTVTNLALSLVIAQAFETFAPWEVVGLPEWARSERYDIIATGNPNVPKPTIQQRREMLRRMLAERFNLVTHYETRDEPVYFLVRAHADGRLGPGMRPTTEDCTAARAAAEKGRAAGEPVPAVTGPVPPCGYRVSGSRRVFRLEGDVPINTLVGVAKSDVRRSVIDRTGLTGDYRVELSYAASALDVGPTGDTPEDAPPFVTAIQEQLGLKLESGRAPVQVLVIDRFERPTEN